MAEEETDKKPRLPDTVPCVLGEETPYEVFKERYKAVYDQVSSMDHLLVGRITYELDISGHKFKLQSLKQSEAALLSRLIATDGKGDFRDLMKMTVYKVVMALAQVGDHQMKRVKVDFSTDLSDWEKEAADAIQVVSEYDQVIIDFLHNAIEDMSRAKDFAFLELLPDPS